MYLRCSRWNYLYCLQYTGCSIDPFIARWMHGYFRWKLQVSIVPIAVVLFLWLCVWGGSSILFSQFCICIPAKLVFVSITTATSLLCGNNRYIMACGWYSLICILHNTTEIIMQTYVKALHILNAVKYILSNMCLGLNQLFQISFIQYSQLFVCSLHIYSVMSAKTCVSDYHRHNIK